MRETVIVTALPVSSDRHMARSLDESGWRVIEIDRAPIENAYARKLSRYLHYHLPDSDFEELLEAEQPDAMVHSAGRASVGMSCEDSEADFRGGTVLTFELLDALRKPAPAWSFLFLSSAAFSERSVGVRDVVPCRALRLKSGLPSVLYVVPNAVVRLVRSGARRLREKSSSA